MHEYNTKKNFYTHKRNTFFYFSPYQKENIILTLFFLHRLFFLYSFWYVLHKKYLMYFLFSLYVSVWNKRAEVLKKLLSTFSLGQSEKKTTAKGVAICYCKFLVKTNLSSSFWKIGWVWTLSPSSSSNILIFFLTLDRAQLTISFYQTSRIFCCAYPLILERKK